MKWRGGRNLEEERESSEWGWGPRFGWRIALSIVSFFGLIIFVIIWLFFFADGFSVYQNIAVIISAILVFFAVMGASWATMWTRYGRRR